MIDPLTATAADLQSQLSSGKVNSVELVELYLSEIEKHNDYLKAVISTAPVKDVLAKARALDEERKSGHVRSPLHGIPILIKDNVATHPDLGMDTTAGSFALVGSRPKKSADVVERLLKAGAIVIGKANLSEMSYWKGDKLLCGWSAVGGQGQSAYVRGGIDPEDSYGGHSNPGGSSAGSAIAVSAGFAPFSIGTETDGSLILPASRAALYTIKPTIGLVSQQGIVPVSAICDSAGPMTKSVIDLANMMDVIVDPATTKIPPGGYASVLTNSWADIRVGVLDIVEWQHPTDIIKPVPEASQQMNAAFQYAYAKIEKNAKAYARNVPLPTGKALELDGKGVLGTLWSRNFAKDFEGYTSGIENSKVYSLAELVQFNKDNAEVELPPEYPNQQRLEEALASETTTEELDAALKHARHVGRTIGVDKILKDHDIDVIIGPAESSMCDIAAASGSFTPEHSQVLCTNYLLIWNLGYPIAGLPLGYLDYNGRPFAMAAIASAHQEALLIKVQSAWEATFPTRQPPPTENFHITKSSKV